MKFRKEISPRSVIKRFSVALGDPCGVRPEAASITELINHYLSRDSFFIISRETERRAALQGSQMRNHLRDFSGMKIGTFS